MGKTKSNKDYRNLRNPYAKVINEERNGDFRIRLVEPKNKRYKREPNLTKKVNDGTFFDEEDDEY